MKWRIDDLPIFAAIVEQSGITAAANSLGLPKSTVSSALSRLEQALGFRLFTRNSRTIRLTAEGSTFYRQTVLILEQVREADATAVGLTAVPSGRLSVALPPAFTQEILAPHLPLFSDAYPDIELEIDVTVHGLSALRESADMAVTVGELADSDFISRTLFSGPLIWVASPAYLAAHQIEPTPEGLRNHVQLCEKRYGQARMPVHHAGRAHHIDLKTGINQVNAPLVVREAVIAGAGLSPLPEHYCRKSIAAGTLVEIGQNVSFDLSASRLSVVYPHRMQRSPRLRAFIDFLTDIAI